MSSQRPNRRSRSVAVSTLVLTLCLSLSAVGVATTALDGADPVELDDCTTLSEPGQYVLTTDLHTNEGDCIVIRADGVTVDGGGHVIRGGDGIGGAGVVVPEGETITDLTVRDLRLQSFAAGVRLRAVTDATLRNVTAERNHVGVGVSNASGVVVSETTLAENGGAGLLVVDSRDVALRRSEARSNGGAGVVFETTVGPTVEAVTTRDNGGSGVVLARSPGGTVSEVIAADNGGAGVFVSLASETLVTNVTSADDGRSGVTVIRSPHTRVVDGTVRGDAVGVRVDRSPRVVVRGVVVDGAHAALTVDDSTDVVLADNRLVDGWQGVVVRGDRTVVRENVVTGHAESAVAVETGAQNVTVTRNVLRENHRGVFLADRSRNATVTENVVVGNRWIGIDFRTWIDRHAVERNLVIDNDVGIQGRGIVFQREPPPPPEPYPHTRDAVIRRNLIVDNRLGISLVYTYGGRFVQVHENGVVGNADCGMRVEGSVANATRNYWGPGGPSSPEPNTIRDPVTGRPADGRGDPVCGQHVGDVNTLVHFDPFLSDAEARALLAEVRRNTTLPTIWERPAASAVGAPTATDRHGPR